MHTKVNIQKKRPNKVKCIGCQLVCTQKQIKKGQTEEAIQSAMHWWPSCLHSKGNKERAEATPQCIGCQLACTQRAKKRRGHKEQATQSAMHGCQIAKQTKKGQGPNHNAMHWWPGFLHKKGSFTVTTTSAHKRSAKASPAPHPPPPSP